ncbi:MAG: peptidoglycan DD-metalloendopeptidase family protein [Longimicrobiales bacterium]
MKPASEARVRHAGWLRVGAAALIVVLLAPVTATAQQDTLQARIRESQQRLQEIRAEREQLQLEMQDLQGQARNISRELQNIERQVDASAEALQELDYQTAALAASVDNITQRLVRTRDHLEERNVVLNERLRNIYKQGPLHAVRVLLSAENFGDLLNRYKYLHLISVHDRMLMDEIAQLEQELTAQEKSLQQSLTQIEQLRAEKLSEFAQLQYLEQSRARTLENVQTRVSRAESRIQQLQADERRLTSVMEELERERLEAERRRAAAGLAAGGGTLDASSLGELPWPVDGELVYRFGPERRPNGVTLRRNGIGISAAPGTPVRSVRGGTVVVASAMEGFGNGVVLSHGAGYYSLYLYLGETRVQEGQDVTTGQVLGTVGPGPDEGPHLYLQLHAPVSGHTPVPVDPLPWLRARP